MANIQDRIIRAAKLDAQLYEEVEADREATGQAMAVVVMSAVAAGIGSLGTGGLLGIVGGTILALAGWFIWAFITYFIGTRLLPEPQTKADYGELLRTIGFASAPGLLRVFGVIPGLGAPHLHGRRNLDAGRHGDRGPTGARLHQHVAGRRCLPGRLVGSGR